MFLGCEGTDYGQFSAMILGKETDMNSINFSPYTSQARFQRPAGPPPPPPCEGHQASGIQSLGTSQLGGLLQASDQLFGGWGSFTGYQHPGFDTSYQNPGFSTAFANPGFTSTGANYYGGDFGSLNFDYSSYAANMSYGNAFGSSGFDYSSLLGLSGVSNAGLSSSSYPYALMLQGMPQMPTF